MNHFHFDGRLSANPILSGSGDSARCRFALIRNEYAGKTAAGENKTRKVVVTFTAFRSTAETIVRHCLKGDQLIVTAHVGNNVWTDKSEVEHFDYDFIIDDFDFGAPGEATRSKLAQVAE